VTMERINKKFGRMMSKGPGDNAKVAIMLKEYDDADKMLAKIVESTQQLRDAWVNIANTQWGMMKEFEGLYDPIAGATEGPRRPSEPTSDLQLSRTFALREAYAELKDELLQEVAGIDAQVIRPAADARDYIQPIRKTIKKRENKRLDYEKAQDKVKKLQKKVDRTPKEDVALVKVETDMAITGEEFQIADDHIREVLPPLVAATFSLIPFLIASLVSVENRLLGVYYTVLHNYCQNNGFDSPPPAMEDVIAAWSANFQPAQRQVESINTLVHSSAVGRPMDVIEDPQARKVSGAVTSTRSGFSRMTSGFKPGGKPADGGEIPRPARIASNTSIHHAPPISRATTPSTDPSPQLSRKSSALGLPTDFTTATMGPTPGSARISPGYSASRERGDYFGHASQLGSSAASTPSAASSTAMSLAKKKKPPPPPPAKRFQSAPFEYVIAQHDYPGGQPGDLAFREGDRIRIVKKTQTTDDWWTGELNGAQGQFPANFCRAA
ncbi:hypothetical protein BN1708_013136, partial [Verticillium longisporum]